MTRIGDDPVLWRHQPIPAGESAIPLLFIHGMWGWHWYWSKYVEAFAAAGHDCYCVDLAGHGPYAGDTGRDRADLARFVSEVSTAVQWIAENASRPVLIGHSMGGLVVQKVMEQMSLRGAVLLGSATPRGVWAFPTFRSAVILAKYFVVSLFARQVKPSDRELVYMVFHPVAGEEQRRALENCVPESGAAYRQTLLGALRVDPDRVTCPVLVVSSEQDRMVRAGTSRRLARRYGATLRVFADHSHWMVREPGWRDVCQSILAWLNTC